MCLINIDDDDTNNLLDDATSLMKEIKQKQDMIVSYFVIQKDMQVNSMNFA